MPAETLATPAPAAPVLPPLRIGPLTVTTPVVLAPMAGVTNRAFRRLCREHGAGLYVAEMVTSRALVERTPESMRIIRHDPDERPRSVQVYGVEPATVGAAVRMLAAEDRADHIDLNFGCPVPKVTRRGGGAVLPWKRDLFAAIVRAAVDAAAPYGVPVTVKMRKGVDEDHLTYLEAGRIADIIILVGFSILAIVVTALLLGSYCAIGLGFSALSTRPTASTMLTLATVLLLLVGLPAVFGLALPSTEREYTVVTPGSRDRGARRIVAGAGGEYYYTDDHYDSFRRIRE